MHNRSTSLSRVVAGLVLARCSCCAEPRNLEPHPQLDAARLFCPGSQLVYLDRGDGLYELEGGKLAADAAPAVDARPDPGAEPDVVSDRPRRTGPKERIILERATFAGR
jgi:hypothetical protein